MLSVSPCPVPVPFNSWLLVFNWESWRWTMQLQAPPHGPAIERADLVESD